MIVSTIGQGRVFLLNILFGMLCMLIFDFFYVLRQRYGKNIIIINALDGLYFIVAFLLILFAGVKYNFGALRYYQIIGILVGILFQSLFSGINRKILGAVYDVGAKVCKVIQKILVKPWIFLLRLILSPLCFLEEKYISFTKKLAKKRKKLKNVKKKNKKTVKKRIKMI